MAVPALRPQLSATVLALLCALALAPAVARAGVSAQIEPGYSTANTTFRDELGGETRVETEQWLQNYRLNLENQLYPLVTVSAGGNLRWAIGSSRSADAGTVDTESQLWNTYARLAAGGPVLNGGIDYARRWEDIETRGAGLTLAPPGVVRESFSGSVGWRPADLPTLNLRLARSTARDDARAITDQTSDEALLSSTFEPAKDLSLRYAIRYGNTADHLTDIERSELLNSGSVTWTGRYLENRGNVYVGYNVSTRTSETSAPLGTGTIAVQQLPVAGLSVIETFPATPLQVTLSPNAALIDGNTSASAGVNLGTSAGAGPEIALRDLGAQFQDVITPVNAIHVYVDRTIPVALEALLGWAAYQSDNNLDWTEVCGGGTRPPCLVTFNPVLLRFEIQIERTQARFLKVITRPLPATAPDPQGEFRDLFVTELQFLEVVPAELARGRTSQVAGNLSATTRLLLVPDLGLAYDFSGFLSHADDRQATWSILNGLSLARRLDPVFAVAARVDRSDFDLGRGLEAQNRWSASLSADPLPTVGGLVSYTGQLSQLEEGTAISNSATLSARADLYEGLAVNGTGSVSLARNEVDVTSRSLLVAASTSIVPNRYVSLTGSASYTDSESSGGGRPPRSDERGFLEASASLAPFPALSVAGSVSRQFGGTTRPVTLASASGAFSPFPGGDLQLRYSYQETFDSAAELRSRVHGPSARWTIRQGWHLAASYNEQESRAPASFQRTRAFNANLLVSLR
jgi:hypothetical protein